MNTEKIIKLGKNASYSNPTKKAKSDYESGWIYNKMLSALQTKWSSSRNFINQELQTHRSRNFIRHDDDIHAELSQNS